MYKQLNIIFILTILIFSNFVAAELDFDVTDSISAGETKTYTVNEADYEITPIFISTDSSNQAKFSINGVLTPLMSAGKTVKVESDCKTEKSIELVLTFISDEGKAKLLIDGVLTSEMNEGQTVKTSNGYEVKFIGTEGNFESGDVTTKFNIEGVTVGVKQGETSYLILSDDDCKSETHEVTLSSLTTTNSEASAKIKVDGVSGSVSDGETVMVGDVEVVMIYASSESNTDVAQVKLSVNGMMSSYLSAGKTFDLIDGSSVYILKISGDSIEFGIKSEAKDTLTEKNTEETILDVDAVVAVKEDVVITTTSASDDEQVCNGCQTESCLPYGTRLEQEGTAKFCDISNTFLAQKTIATACQNNYECLSNQCIDGTCGSLSQDLKETRGVMQKILDWLANLF